MRNFVPENRMKIGNLLCRNGLLFAAACLAAIFAARGDTPTAPANDKFKGLEFRELGPAVMGGRIDDFAVVESNPDIVYVGAASGGVWKTTNNGTTWEPVFDKEAVSTVGDIAIAPSDPSIVWVGTGEPNNRQSSSWGDGVYKSMDAGKTWQNMGLAPTHHIGRIVINPRNPNVVYVAALGHLWGPNPERGVYKTSDGGKTWSQVLKINDDTGVSDIAMDPQSPDTLYAAAYRRRRTVFGFNGGGPDGAIYKTVDGGITWKKLVKGLPYENGGDTGRIGLDIYRKNPNIVYALVQHEQGGIFRSEDMGETWKKMSDTDPRPSYYSQVRIDPNNDLRIWALGAAMYFSEDGGKTFATDRVRKIHGDFHALWIDPADSNHVLAGSDGGIHWSYDNGKSWDFVNTIAIGQFYEIGLDHDRPYRICGGLQDNGSWCGPARSLTTDGITNQDWVLIHGGDGFYAQPDPVEPWIVYTESQDGDLARRDIRTGQERSIEPQAKLDEPHYRFNWNSPVLISSHNHETIYYGGNYLFKSTNRGDAWVRLGSELTSSVDRNKLPVFGKAPDKSTLSRHDGVEEYPTITTISESPLTENVLWVGTDDGNLQVSRDAGKNWKNVASRVPGVPKGIYVSRVLASKYAEGAAYATFDGHRADDYSIYIFVTTDYGETWQPLRDGIPDTAGSVHVIREHPVNANLLFAGMEFGLWISQDRGANWSQLKNNFPTVPVDDIQIHPRENDLVLATHGRSIWVLDDMTPLEKMDARLATSGITFFPPRPATLWFLRTRRWSSGQKFFTAKNPPYGALINYYLQNAIPLDVKKTDKDTDKDKDKKKHPAEEDKSKKEAPEKKEGPVKITVFDKDNKMIRQFDGPGTAGFDRAAWDLRYDPASEPTAEQKEAMAAGYYEGPRGPRVDPGEYTIKIKTPVKEVSQKVTVEEDPRITLSASDRAARRAALDDLYAMAKTSSADRKKILALQAALKAAQAQWKHEAEQKNGVKIPEAVQTQAEELLKKVNDLARKYHREREGLGNAGPPFEWLPAPLPIQLQGLMEDIDDFAAAPGQQQTEKIAELKPQVSDASVQVRKLMEEDLPALNKKMNEAGVPHIAPNLDGSDAVDGADLEEER
jgi:photosystem II stability/assembly factor-like uncharacterized protein